MNRIPLGLLGGLLAAALSAQAADPAHPNVLVILTDDMRWDAMGVVQREEGKDALYPWFKTPHIDRLAAEGARFANMFVTTSLCSPSRASMISGQYAHKHRC
jgi:arylsulfatase A-like enzyme